MDEGVLHIYSLQNVYTFTRYKVIVPPQFPPIIMETSILTVCIYIFSLTKIRGKERDLTQSYEKNSKRQTMHSQNNAKTIQIVFVYTKITDQLMTALSNNNSHPTGVVDLMFKGHSFPLLLRLCNQKVKHSKFVNKPLYRDRWQKDPQVERS